MPGMKGRTLRLVLAAAFLLAAGLIFRDMYTSQTPPAHADHDHAMATLDAGGFLWLQAPGGGRRNLVGRPGKVLVLHWFDPAASDGREQRELAGYAREAADDPMVEVLFVAEASSRDGLESWAAGNRVPGDRLYLDPGRRTGQLMGVRRMPETLIYDPGGRLAHQTRGPADWSGPSLRMMVEKAKKGVPEIA